MGFCKYILVFLALIVFALALTFLAFYNGLLVMLRVFFP